MKRGCFNSLSISEVFLILYFCGTAKPGVIMKSIEDIGSVMTHLTFGAAGVGTHIPENQDLSAKASSSTNEKNKIVMYTKRKIIEILEVSLKKNFDYKKF